MYQRVLHKTAWLLYVIIAFPAHFSNLIKASRLTSRELISFQDLLYLLIRLGVCVCLMTLGLCVLLNITRLMKPHFLQIGKSSIQMLKSLLREYAHTSGEASLFRL